MNRFLIAASVAALSAGTAQATHFNFTDTVQGHSVTGSFDGTLSGDLITDMSNIFVFVDGIGFHDNGSLQSFHFNDDFSAYEYGGIASLDGAHDNFFFVDGDVVLGEYYTNYYYTVTNISTGIGNTNSQQFYGGATDNFHATVAGSSPTPEPASWAMMVGGFGLIGAALRRRTTVRFA
ncbi:MAG TPA: PEPxxWA-CTERM sorting domain-containing protein [Sphingomonas sp.]|uniref:PEPxxWA-CTERM sorting domain-containing protein n=1 Tax=Sphingomonas sp. TaxID=28214 RepID=UPI002C9E1D66|nr:PEPxxWA-CTERM sorting domain-containing protein [Sphingomonas sp.]HMI19420.1 PEPxxWA-CTERM sorting domain-containing protein [Sphingomonas sp.]